MPGDCTIAAVRCWNLHEYEMPGGSRSPIVLHSQDEGRAVLIGLDAGQALGEHQVKEHVFLLVVDGQVRVDAGGSSHECGAGALVHFEPDERHAVSSRDGARILLLLAPWPGAGHYRGDEQLGSR
jgi:quercetin dioxygenase-like cupin family protein